MDEWVHHHSSLHMDEIDDGRTRARGRLIKALLIDVRLLALIHTPPPIHRSKRRRSAVRVSSHLTCAPRTNYTTLFSTLLQLDSHFAAERLLLPLMLRSDDYQSCLTCIR